MASRGVAAARAVGVGVLAGAAAFLLLFGVLGAGFWHPAAAAATAAALALSGGLLGAAYARLDPVRWRALAVRAARAAPWTVGVATAWGLAAGTVAARAAAGTDAPAWPFALQALLLFAAVLLGAPALVLAARAPTPLAARDWALPLVGAVAVLLALDLVAHSIGCAVTILCDGPDYGRFHQLHHTLLGGVPAAVLYAVALRRWTPPR